MCSACLKRWFVSVLCLGVVLGAVTARADDLPPLTHGLTPIKGVAPALRLADMDGRDVDLGTLRGRVVVVNFWATWCPPCRREMSSLERLYRQLKDRGLEVLAVNVGEDVETAFSFTGTLEEAPSFPILFDTDSAALQAWQVKGLPTTFVVGPDGSLAYRAVGGREFDHREIVRAIRALLPR